MDVAAAADDEDVALVDAIELDDVTTVDVALDDVEVAAEDDEIKVFETGVELLDATLEEEEAALEAPAGAGQRATFRYKVRVALPPQFSVYWESEQAIAHRAGSKSVVLDPPLTIFIPQ